MKSVAEFLEKNAIKYPDKIAVSCKNNTITYSEINKKVNQFANVLLKKGIKRGDIVYLYLNKSINKIIAIFGIMKCGAGVAIVNRAYKVEQINHIIKGNQSSLLISNEMVFDTIKDKLKIFDTILLPDSDNSDYLNGDDANIGIEIDPKETGVVIFTSGSSGNPKGVIITNENLIQRTISEVQSFQLTEKDNILNVTTFSFDVGLNQLLTSFYIGAKLILHDFIFVRSLLSCIEKENITGFSGIPTIWTKLLNESNLLSKYDLKDLRYVTISGGSLSKKHVMKLLALLKGIEIIKTYGQTETFRSTMLFCRSVEYTDKIDSIGKAIDGVRLIVADTKLQKICQPGETGELIHIGQGIMAGYISEVHDERKLIEISSLGLNVETKCKHGVLTGDIVSIDEDGYVYYKGRKDDMMKISGYRVYPIEIEDILVQHLNVKEAVVWGVATDNLSGESIYAVITLKNNLKVDTNEFLSHCRDMLPSYLIPEKISIINKMPLMPNKKIDIISLKNRFTVDHV